MLFLNNKIMLAPMAGITDPVFRLLCKEQGADIVVSEMVSAEGLLHRSDATDELIQIDERERPAGVQLFGSDPQRMAEAAAYVQEKARPDFIDLNAGCPVPKVVKRNGGASLLRNRDLFGKIVKAMAAAVTIPLTVKLRSGWVTGEWVDTDFAQLAQDCGASAIILHPRSRAMGFGGHSFWERITQVKKAVTVPVIGNGDITSPSEALRMLKETGCDSIMIGRSAYGNPWLFRQVREAFQGLPNVEPSLQDRCAFALCHIALFRERYGEKKAATDMKKHVAWYLRGFPGVARLRDRVFRAGSSGDLEKVLREVRDGDR